MISGIAVAASFLIPWALCPGLRDSNIFPKSIAATAAAGAGFLFWAWGGRPSLAVGLEGPLAAMLVAVVASTALSIDPALSLWGPDLVPLFSLYGFACVLAAFYLGVAAARAREGSAARVAEAIALGSIPVSTLALVQVCFPERFPMIQTHYIGRVVGTFGHPVALGAYLSMVLPVSFALAADGERPRAWRIAVAFSGALAACGLFFSRTRSGWIAAAAACGALLWFSGGARLRRAGMVVAAAGLIAAVAGGFFIEDASRLHGGRPVAWTFAGRAFVQRPLMGHGPGTFGYLFRSMRTDSLGDLIGTNVVYPHAHNDWLEAFATVGAIGAAAYAWLHAAVLLGLRGRAVSGALLAAPFAVFVFAKLNSPTISVAFLGVLALGTAFGSLPPGRAQRPAAALFLIAVCLAGWGTLRSLPAERAALLGRRDRRAGSAREAARHFETAIRWNPENLTFRRDFMNLLWDSASDIPAPQRAVLLDRARDAALEGISLRPYESEFLMLLARAETQRVEAGERSAASAARAALELAGKLDPLNPRLPEARERLSRAGSVGAQ